MSGRGLRWLPSCCRRRRRSPRPPTDEPTCELHEQRLRRPCRTKQPRSSLPLMAKGRRDPIRRRSSRPLRPRPLRSTSSTLACTAGPPCSLSRKEYARFSLSDMSPAQTRPFDAIRLCRPSATLAPRSSLRRPGLTGCSTSFARSDPVCALTCQQRRLPPHLRHPLLPMRRSRASARLSFGKSSRSSLRSTTRSGTGSPGPTSSSRGPFVRRLATHSGGEHLPYGS